MGAIGERLRREREKKKISLDEVAQTTKISTRMLRAIEEERFDQLPGGIFNKGFVRAYARHLGLDENEAVADYVAATQPAQPEPPEAAAKAAMELQAQRQSRSTFQVPWGTLAAVLLVAALGFALWGSFSRQSGSKLLHAPASSPAPSAQTVLAQKPDRPPEKTPAAISDRPADEDAAARVTPSPKPGDSASATVPGTDEDAPAAAPFRVVIRAREDCWVRITADGKEIMQDTLQAQAEKSVFAQRELVIKTGNIAGLELWFNGQRVPLQGDANEVKTLFFEPSGLVASTATIQPPQNPLP